MKDLYFKVKYGFNSSEQISIKEDELEKALYAQKFGVVAQLSNKQINGKYIISIEPDINKYTGWYDSYSPSSAEEFAQIRRDCPPEINDVIRAKREKVDYLISKGQQNLIGKNIPISELKRIS